MLFFPAAVMSVFHRKKLGLSKKIEVLMQYGFVGGAKD
jgi:hypothetical protein